MTVKLAAALPKDHTDNGLNRGEAAFLARPMEQVVIVAYVDVEKITTNYDKATKEPTVKIAAVEIVDDPAVRRAFETARDRRINVAPKLPVEDEPEEVAPKPCGRCNHAEVDHDDEDGCQDVDELGDACECHLYLDPDAEQLALTDGVDVEATLREASAIVEAEVIDGVTYLPCTCGHSGADHDTDTGECYATGDCGCATYTTKEA